MPTPVHLTVPEPCQENWQNMTSNKQGRHCLSCQKTVVDFSLMSDQEILHYISTTSSRVCGRFTHDQLNKMYEEKKRSPRFAWRYAWNMIVSSFLLTSSAVMAQSTAPSTEQAATGKKNESIDEDKLMMGVVAIKRPQSIKGVITDEKTGEPLNFVSVFIKGSKSGTATREDGSFSLDAPDQKNKLILVISAIGYTTTEFKVPLKESAKLKILLPQADRALQGEVVIVKKVSVPQKIKRGIKSWLPQKEIRVYPNPVVAGSSVTVKLNLKETGDYKMELTDASGRIMSVQSIQVNQANQSISLPTEAGWCSGVYWLHVSRGTKRMYQAKVLLQ